MAGTLSACPGMESALSKAAPPAPRAVAVFLPLASAGVSRVLQAVALLHVGALLFALFHPIALSSLVVVVTGLTVTLIALSIPRFLPRAESDLAPRPAFRDPAGLAPAQDRTQPQVLSQQSWGSGASPSPLPFMGERITLDPAAIEFSSLARAAARLSRLSSVRAHPWADLIARVSHELRTPLNAVIGFSDVMQSELLGPVGHPRYREYARHIRDCGRDLLKSAEDTLAITYLLDHDPEAATEAGVDFRAVAEDAWAFHADPLAAGSLSLDVDVPDGLEVLVDGRPLRQILINLFAEAVRRAGTRGEVGLVVTVDGDLAQIEVFLRGRPGDALMGQASLPMCLARALLELNGASLIEVDDPASTWRAVTVLPCAAQQDFFVIPKAAAAQHALHLC